MAIIFLAVQLPAQTNSNGTQGLHRVVMQLTSNDTLAWKGLMNNIKNLKSEWDDSVVIEVVAHGPGIELLVTDKTTQQEKIAYFKTKGVLFMACENTMRERKIAKAAIISEAGFVKTGVGEVILKQEQGWSYLKAGF
jgi:intracellular sulfur oxidation DsrE/DsrF family protein